MRTRAFACQPATLEYGPAFRDPVFGFGEHDRPAIDDEDDRTTTGHTIGQPGSHRLVSLSHKPPPRRAGSYDSPDGS
jgi:hypothetical protein